MPKKQTLKWAHTLPVKIVLKPTKIITALKSDLEKKMFGEIIVLITLQWLIVISILADIFGGKKYI